MNITNELLAAYAQGNVSDSERKAVRQYLIDHQDELEMVARMMDKDYDIQLENTERLSSHSFNNELNALLNEIDSEELDTSIPSISILPLTSRAAQNVVDNLCAVRCEGYALRTLGVDVSDEELEKEAENQGWLKADGTSLYSIGQLSSKHGLLVSRKYECNLFDIINALIYGDIIIAVIDSTELKLEPEEAERIDQQFGRIPNHAIVVKSIDIENDRISLLNPGDTTDSQEYPLKVFLEAWNDSANCLIISNHNHYKPHPVNLSDVSLDYGIRELREAIAENAHEVWAKARKDDGWVYGSARDDFRKTDPNLLPYDLLPNKEKDYFRLISMESIKFLKKCGWKFINDKNAFQ